MQPNSPNMENQPQFEIPSFREGLERQNEKAQEKSTDKESEAGRSQPQPVSASPPVIPDISSVQSPTTTLPVDVASSGSDPGTVVQAADTDKIEKEWVLRAKSIIAQTKDDPHEQKKAISKVKAEYIQKRFGKAVPTDDAITA